MTRIIGGLILLVVLALPVIIGPSWLFFVLAAVVVFLCLFELYRVILSPEARILGWIVCIGSLPYLGCLYLASMEGALGVLSLLATLVIISGLALYEKRLATGTEVGLALSGLIYPLILFGFWILIRNGIDGRFWMIFGLLCTFIADTGAYYTGRSLGRRHLAVRLSPKKTWEGLAGGVVFSMVIGTLFVLLFTARSPLESAPPLWSIPLLAAGIALLGLVGDLMASLFKREFNVKDMGQLIPGHGGMLDRMDGIIPVGAVLYLFLKVIP